MVLRRFRQRKKIIKGAKDCSFDNGKRRKNCLTFDLWAWCFLSWPSRFRWVVRKEQTICKWTIKRDHFDASHRFRYCNRTQRCWVRNVRLIDAMNRSQMKNKIYHFGSFARNFYLSVVKLKVPHLGIKLQTPRTDGRVFKRRCCSFSLTTMGKMLIELIVVFLSCLKTLLRWINQFNVQKGAESVPRPAPLYWWFNLKHKALPFTRRLSYKATV